MTSTTREAREASRRVGADGPTTPHGRIRRTQEVAAVLEVDAVERDRAPGTPDEVHRREGAGLVTLLGPASQGRAGPSWEIACTVVRRRTGGEGSVGRLHGRRDVRSALGALSGVPGQAERIHGMTRGPGNSRKGLPVASGMRTRMHVRDDVMHHSCMAGTAFPHRTPRPGAWCRRMRPAA
jgi:hypothetical protein